MYAHEVSLYFEVLSLFVAISLFLVFFSFGFVVTRDILGGGGSVAFAPLLFNHLLMCFLGLFVLPFVVFAPSEGERFLLASLFFLLCYRSSCASL